MKKDIPGSIYEIYLLDFSFQLYGETLFQSTLILLLYVPIKLEAYSNSNFV